MRQLIGLGLIALFLTMFLPVHAATPSYSLLWSKQLDSTSIYIQGVHDHILAISTTPHVYIVSLYDGSVSYSSPAYNTLRGQYGVLGIGVPTSTVSSSDGSISAWITSAKWLHVVIIGKSVTYLSIQLSDYPASIGMLDDGSYIVVGMHSGLLQAFH